MYRVSVSGTFLRLKGREGIDCKLFLIAQAANTILVKFSTAFSVLLGFTLCGPCLH